MYEQICVCLRARDVPLKLFIVRGGGGTQIILDPQEVAILGILPVASHLE